METEAIWEKILVPIIIGPIFVIIKVLYDRWDFKKKESKILSNKLKLEKVNNKLQQFYWPIYILLLKDFDLWSKIVFKDTETIGITESDSESEIEDNGEYNYCNYSKADSNGYLVPCKNPVAVNCSDRHGTYCIKHQHQKHKKVLETWQILYKNTSLIKKNIEKEVVTYNTEQKQQNIQRINDTTSINIDIETGKLEEEIKKSSGSDSDSSESLRSIIESSEHNIPGNITGNKIGEVTTEKSNNDIDSLEIKSEMMRQIIESVIDNHSKINNIITDNIAVAEPRSSIGKQFVKFIKFANIFKSQVNSDDLLINPSKYGAPYPKKLLPMVEIKLFKLQKEYNTLIHDYYNF